MSLPCTCYNCGDPVGRMYSHGVRLPNSVDVFLCTRDDLKYASKGDRVALCEGACQRDYRADGFVQTDDRSDGVLGQDNWGDVATHQDVELGLAPEWVGD